MSVVRITRSCLPVGPPPSARAVEDSALASAQAAAKARDRASAIRYYQTYLTAHPDAPDAATQALRLAYVFDWDKAAASQARSAFQSVANKYPSAPEAAEALYRAAMIAIRGRQDDIAKPELAGIMQRYPGSAAASMARFTLAHYAIRSLRYDDAIAAFAQVADDARLPPEMTDEALLQTGILSIQKFKTPAYISASGKADRPATAQARVALLKDARVQMLKVERRLSSVPDSTGVHQSAAALADCALGEIFLLEHAPMRAEQWYRKAMARTTSTASAPVRTIATLGLGVALFREGRMREAEMEFDAVLKNPVTGRVLYGLRAPDFLIPQAQIWAATAAHHLGNEAGSMGMARQAVEMFHGQEPTDGEAREVWLVSTHFVAMMDHTMNHPEDGMDNPLASGGKIATALAEAEGERP